ncbi:MAG: helix-turn-helix domain-containing protein [Desulfovibrio sp.]|jgi:transcriptional regulator with XRE-family HTH domain|nr:helix-turn-helix domain-containing protein [Desulfovibrio sp.]
MLYGLMNVDKTKLTMGLIVQSLREGLGMSRYALAKEAGVDCSWLRRFEQGKSGIRVETLIALACGLKIPSATIIAAMEKEFDNPDRLLDGHVKKGPADKEQ